MISPAAEPCHKATTCGILCWLLAVSWFLAILAVVLSLRMVGQQVLETRYGPDLIVSGVKNDGRLNAQRPGDAIVAIDGVAVATAADIRRVLADAKPETVHQVLVHRAGRPVRLAVHSYRLTVRDWLGDNLAILLYGLCYLVGATLLVLRGIGGPLPATFAGMAMGVGLYAVVGVAYLTAQTLWPVVVLLQPLQAFGLLAFGLALRYPDRTILWPWYLAAVWGLLLLPTYVPHGPQGGAGLVPYAWHHALETIGQWCLVLSCVVGLWVMALQGLRHSGRFSLHRQQVKIILAATLVSLAPAAWVWLIAIMRGQQPYPPVAALALVATGIMPLATAAALSRSRLAELERLIRLTLTYTLTAGTLGAGYFGLYTLLSALGGERMAITSEWQFGLLLGLAVVFEPAALGVGRSLDRFLYGDRWDVTEMLVRIQGYGAAEWSQDTLLAQIARDVSEAAQLQTVAVALPDGDGWRIAAGHGDAVPVGRLLAGHLPDRTAFWAGDGTDLAGYRAALHLTLAARPVSLLLLGDRRDGLPLSEIDLRYVSLFLAPLSGMIGFAQSRDRQRRAETAIARLYDQIGLVNLAVLNQSATAWGQDGLHGPLRCIVDQAGELLDGAFGLLDPVQYRRIELIRRHAQRLDRAITDTDELKALLSGTATIARQPVALADVVQQAWSRVRQQAELQAVRLIVLDRYGGVLVSDPPRLERVVEHLLDNAVTHSPEGGAVTCRWAAQDDRLVLSVADAGPGIPPERLQAIQTLAMALPDPDHQQQGRLGIGLVLVHATVRLLGGTVTIVSDGTGTTVTLSLPIGAAVGAVGGA